MPRLIATQWLALRVGCAAAALLVIAPLPGIAAVLHVPADYPTIAAAVAAATSTDEVHVGPGVYAERLDLSSRRLILRATAGPAFTTIDGEGLGMVITWTNAASGCVFLSNVGGAGGDGVDSVVGQFYAGHGGTGGASDFVLVGGANVAFAGEFVHGYRPGPGSPLIDRGHVFDLPMDTLDVDGDFLTGESLPLDLAGISRRIDDPAVADTGVRPPPMPDIGAYERLPTFTVTAGDMNCDGRFDNYDIDVFVLALVQPVVYGHVHRNCSLLAGDFDADGALTNFDIDAFVAALLE